MDGDPNRVVRDPTAQKKRTVSRVSYFLSIVFLSPQRNNFEKILLFVLHNLISL